MAKPDLGTKRICANCGTKFYDFNRDPIVCPKCETVFRETQQPAPAGKPAPAAAAKKEVAEPTDVELVSLEEADKEKRGGKRAATAGSEEFDLDEEAIEDDDEASDPFLEVDEDEDEDVTEILGSGIDDDDEEV